MELFNPWLGFPARNAVYLDQDFARMRGNGQRAYGTTQTAYAAADALQVAVGGQVVIMVGVGTFGNLTLTADYNFNVLWAGINKGSSAIGVIDARADPAWSVNLVFSNLTIGNVLSGSTVSGSTAAISLSGNGSENCTVGNVLSNAGGSADGGDITLSNLTCGTVQSQRAGAGTDSGDITISNCITGAITSGAQDGTIGDISIENSETGDITLSEAGSLSQFTSFSVSKSECGSIVFSGSGTFIGSMNLQSSSFVRILNALFDGSTGVKINKCEIQSSATSCISQIGDAYIINESILVCVGGNNDCIEDLGGSTTSIISESILIPSGTGVPVNASSPSIVVIRNVTVTDDVSASVTVDGDLFIYPNFISPI